MNEAIAYKQTEIKTSNNVRIISLLYDGAINFIKMGIQKLKQGDIAGKGLYASKATSIVGELASSLNMEAGGEISTNLRRLYDFVLDRLLYANLKNDIEAFESAEEILNILRDGWKKMEANMSSQIGNQLNRPIAQGIRI